MLSTTVLIVGSGPIGLWLAYELKRAGLDVLVIDTLPSREARCPYSKALSMSASTLETFESRGIAKYFLASGMPLPKTHFGGLPTLLELNYEILGVQHCHNLAIPQSKTETILLDRCDEVGVRFSWGLEFEDLKQNLEGVTATAREVNDTEISGRVQINASWVVGCDGTHSKVRKAVGISFEGTPSNLTGMLADIQLTTKPQQIPLIAKGSSSGSMLAPMGDGLYFRFVGMTDENMHKSASEEVTLDQIRECMRDAFDSDFGAHSPLWLSRYGNAARVATSFREGRVFLAGDAAHQFFPAGGQGMNLGIQDATSLVWRLVMISRGLVSGAALERIMNSYTSERRTAAKVIVENVQAQTAILSANTQQMIAVRNLLSEALQNPELNAMWARRVTGFDEPTKPYRFSDLEGQPNNALEDPMLGQRITHLRCGEQGDKYFHIGVANKFVLLFLENSREDIENVEVVKMARNCNNVEVSDIIVNSKQSVWMDISAVLIRPDTRVAWIARSKTPAEERKASLETVFRWWFGI